MDHSSSSQVFEDFINQHPLRHWSNNGIEGTYLLCGKGSKTMLLFHGLAGSATSMYLFIQAFEQDYRIICPTIPVLHPSDAPTAIDFVQSILGHENLQPEIVVGGSFGGLLAQAYWFRNPSVVKKVFLFDTVPPNKLLGLKNKTAASIFQYIPWCLFKPLFIFKLKKMFDVSSGLSVAQKKSLQDAKLRLTDRMKEVSKQLLLTHSRIAFDIMLTEPNSLFDLSSAQLLVIQSTDDPATKDAVALFERTYPFARVVLFQGAKHLGSILYFEEYIAAMRQSLDT
jgi:pimeloyl-ACP methyl ester carboxylesterase